MTNDLVTMVAEAMYRARHELPEAYPAKMGAVTRQHYEGMAQAAIDALSIEHWQAAPGDKRECPACKMDWLAREAGPLDIAWTPSP